MKISSSENTVGTEAFSAEYAPATKPTSAPTAIEAFTRERRHSGRAPRSGSQTETRAWTTPRAAGREASLEALACPAAIDRPEQGVAGGERGETDAERRQQPCGDRAYDDADPARLAGGPTATSMDAARHRRSTRRICTSRS